jgi:inosine-uridine nucleoside N-ribohydrolase
MTRTLLLLIALALAAPAAGKQRVWIDTDPACGLGTTSDPDDCFALLELLASLHVEIVGISTTFGNASIAETTSVARELLSRWGGPRPPLHAGAANAAYWGRPSPTAASRAIASALQREPLTFVALGPLTNLWAALAQQPSLSDRIVTVIAVMGKQPGEIFHPAEGSPRALFGHGPIFSDLNFVKDPRAAEALLGRGLPFTLVPYAAGKKLSVTQRDLAAMASRGGADAWVAESARGWLAFWRNVVGRDGFYPFDLAAAIVAANPTQAVCNREAVAVRPDRDIGWFGFGPLSLLFAKHGEPGAIAVTVCRTIVNASAIKLVSDPP